MQLVDALPVHLIEQTETGPQESLCLDKKTLKPPKRPKLQRRWDRSHHPRLQNIFLW